MVSARAGLMQLPKRGAGLKSVGDDSLFACYDHDRLWEAEDFLQFVVAKTSSHTDSEARVLKFLNVAAEAATRKDAF